MSRSLAPTFQTPSTTSLMLEAYGCSDPGPDGKINEDSWVVRDTVAGGQILVVCDGMGGMGRGDEASQLAAKLLVDRLASCAAPGFDALVESIAEVDLELRGALCREESHRHPGSTTAVAHVHEGRVTVGWVGDSSVMLVRNGEIISRTKGHRLVQKLIESGMMTEGDARVSPMGRMLSRSLGGRGADDEVVKPGLLERWTLQEGDWLVLCSDGLTDFVPTEEIVTHLHGTVDGVVHRLVDLAKQRDPDDNITVVVARCGRYDPRAAHQVGAPWAPADDPSRATLPPADYRSGILRQHELVMVPPEDAPADDRSKLMMGALVVLLGIFLLLLGILAFLLVS